MKRRLTPPNPDERLSDRLGADPELVRDGDRRGGVERVVQARHRQHEILELDAHARAAVADEDAEARAAAALLDVHEAHVGLRVLAIGQDAPVLDPADEVLHDRVIGAHHGKAVERDVVDEGAEGVLDGVEGLEVVEVLGVDVGDDRDVGRELEEGAVRFVGLDHHPVALAHAGVGAVGVDDAAVDHRRVESAGVEQRRDERGRGGLAVRAGDGDAGLEAHQLGEHLGPAHDRQAALAGDGELGVVAADRGRDDDDLGAVDVLGLVADEGLDAFLSQAA